MELVFDDDESCNQMVDVEVYHCKYDKSRVWNGPMESKYWEGILSEWETVLEPYKEFFSEFWNEEWFQRLLHVIMKIVYRDGGYGSQLEPSSPIHIISWFEKIWKRRPMYSTILVVESLNPEEQHENYPLVWPLIWIRNPKDLNSKFSGLGMEHVLFLFQKFCKEKHLPFYFLKKKSHKF